MVCRFFLPNTYQRGFQGADDKCLMEATRTEAQKKLAFNFKEHRNELNENYIWEIEKMRSILEAWTNLLI